VFLIVISIKIGLLSYKIRNGDGTPKDKILNIKFVFQCSVQSLSEKFLILRRNEREMIKNVCWSSCKTS